MDLSDPLLYVVILAVLLVLAILMFGVGTFGMGGDFNRRNANKIMRWRIYAQGAAVALILLYVFLRSRGG
jgi:hypothetical protein